jgi:hypothetical protein
MLNSTPTAGVLHSMPLINSRMALAAGQEGCYQVLSAVLTVRPLERRQFWNTSLEITSSFF